MADRPNGGDQGALMERERAGWDELHSIVDALTPDQAERAGYFEEGWSAKDAIAHIGTWLAEGGVIMERIAMGTYRRDELDVDAMNAEFYESMRDVPLDTVRIQAWAARTRMVRAWVALPELTPDAVSWIAKSGPEHYDEHLPRLRAWAKELGG